MPNKLLIIMLLSLLPPSHTQLWDCYNEYCFFTYGFNVTVPCLSLADHMCQSDLKNSHPLEIVNNRTLREVSDFIWKYVPNLRVILNAHLIAEGTYFWKHKNKLVELDLRQKDRDENYCLEQLYIYRGEILCGKQDEELDYGVVCMIECSVSWSTSEVLPKSEHEHSNITKQQDCLNICLLQPMCRGYIYGRHKRRYICETGVTSSLSTRKVKGVFFYKRLQTSYASCTDQLGVREPPPIFGSCSFAFTPVSLRLVLYSMVAVLLINMVLFIMVFTNTIPKFRKSIGSERL